MPATIFFFIMNLVAFTHMGLSDFYIHSFCGQLRNGICSMYKPVTGPSSTQIIALKKVTCGTLFQIFSLNNTPSISPVLNLYFVNSFSIVSAVLWIIALLIMLCRIIFVIDFQLMRVTLKRIILKKGTDSLDKNSQIQDWITIAPVSEKIVEESLADIIRRDDKEVPSKDSNESNMQQLRKRNPVGSSV